MNISFQNKAAWGLIAITACLVALWHYETRIVGPQRQAMIDSLRTNLHERDQLQGVVQNFQNIRGDVQRVSAQGSVDDSVVASIQHSLTDIAQANLSPTAEIEGTIEDLESDLNDFLKITNQLDLYEQKIKQFTDGFAFYFQDFGKELTHWKEAAVETIADGGQIANTLPFAALSQRVSVLEKVIPEYDSFKQKLQSLELAFDRWAADINAATTIDEKQAIFGQRQHLLDGLRELFGTFNGYALKTLEKERDNVAHIARQIDTSIAAIEAPFQEQFGMRNNAAQTQVVLSQYKDRQYRIFKSAAIVVIFAALIILFFALVIYSFRFERGFALFKKQTFKAAQDSRELAASLNDHTTLIIKNFDLARSLKEGLEQTADGFSARQLNLQHVDRMVRDTDILIKESQESFLNIKEEFYNAEKVSQEIVHLTGALEGVAQQMTSIAERASLTIVDSSAPQTDSKKNAIDELKYLSGRIRHAVDATHVALDARKEKIEETKAKFDSVEKNMTQMTQNTQEALHGLALARLDHSEEASRINEILETARATSRAIASEIDALNKQVSDFSVLGKHLDALHELAVKASALNAQSLLVEEKAPAQLEASQRMNDHIQEYFKKVFEATSSKKPANRLDAPPTVAQNSPASSSSINQTPADV